MNKIPLTIDGVTIKANKGTTILEAALENGIYIPHLCHHPDLKPVGVCRLCMVEIEGRPMTTSCTTPVEEGMVVWTESPGINEVRRVAVELLIVNHVGDCLQCAKNMQCELLRVANYVGIDENRLKRLRRATRVLPIDTSNPFFDHDPNKCILCGICVRTCDELQAVGAIDFAFRGYSTVISTFGNKPLAESICRSCGECMIRCPVGALSPKKSIQPSHEIETICPYCGVGCGIYLGVRGNMVVNVRGNEDSPVNKGSLCVKGRFGYEFINHPDRLTSPLIRKNGKLAPAKWDEALDMVASRLVEIKAEFGSDSLAVLSSAKCTNEENYLMQKFTRAVLGTNNIDHCARLCHSTTVAGLAESFGSGAMTNSISEIEKTDVLLVIGSNTTEAHPVIGTLMKRAVKSRGVKLIVIDPRRTELARLADVHLRPRLGTDVAYLNGLMNVIISEDLHDRQFIETRTEGFDRLKETVKRYTPEYVEGISGIPAEDLRKAARLYASAEKAMIFYTMGITQHTTGTDNVMSIANLAMLTGNVGREGTGVNPLRGQNNVQGACDMGALPNVYPGYQRVTDGDIRNKFERAWGVNLPASVGLTVVEMIHSAHEGKIRGMYIMGENPMLSDPDVNYVRSALENLDFLVVQDIFLSETAELADVVLPASSFAEKDGTFTNTERRVQLLHRAINPIGNSRPDWEIICDLSTRMGYETRYESPAQIMDEIAKLTPIYGGISYDRLAGDGLQWPCPDRTHPGTKFLHQDKFSRGLGKFHVVEFRPPYEMPDEEYPFLLTTGRVLYHYHTGTLTRRSAGLSELHPEERVEINPVDADRLSVKDGDLVEVASRRGSVLAKVKLTDRSPVGTVFMTFHFKESAANLLTVGALDPIAKIPEYKVCAVKIQPVRLSSEPAIT